LEGKSLVEVQAGGTIDGRGEELRVRVLCVDGIALDHPWRGALPQVSERRSGAADLREQLDVEVAVPVLVGECLERARVGGAGVVDQDVDPAQRFRGGGNEVSDLVREGHVHHLVVNPGAKHAQLLCGAGDSL